MWPFSRLSASKPSTRITKRLLCHCLDQQERGSRSVALDIHTEGQNTDCQAWQHLNELIEKAARDGQKEFDPGLELDADEWSAITVLPPTIAKLKAVKYLNLYGSSLVRIPPEIGEMEALEEFTPYTSYRLHWFPYEITRCKKLRKSTISTRALYGNYKYRLPFPRLPQVHRQYFPNHCSVCGGPLSIDSVQQVWISLAVASDVVPLLVHACSTRCIFNLPKPPEGYVRSAHTGGLELKQPESDW